MKSLFFAGTNGSGKSTFRAYTMSDLLSGAITIDPDVLTKNSVIAIKVAEKL